MIENHAKRGDYVLLPHHSSATMMHGARMEKVSYVINLVTSVSREGWVKESTGKYGKHKIAAYDRPLVISLARVKAKYGVDVAQWGEEMTAGEWDSAESARLWLQDKIKAAMGV